jgi:hypothetical protein
VQNMIAVKLRGCQLNWSTPTRSHANRLKLVGTSPMQHPTHSTQSAVPAQQPVHPPSRATGAASLETYDWHATFRNGTVQATLAQDFLASTQNHYSTEGGLRYGSSKSRVMVVGSHFPGFVFDRTCSPICAYSAASFR